MPAIIVIDTRNPQETKTINLSWETDISQEYIIGRDPSCNIVLDDILVSRIHGKFGLREENYYYCDLSSKNGSKINNTVAKPNQEYFLKPSDTITLGNHLIWVKAISGVESPASNSNIPKTSVPKTSISIPPPAMCPSTPPVEDYKCEEEFSLEESGVVDYEDEELSFDVSPDLEFSFEVEEELEIIPPTSMSSPIQSPWDEEDEDLTIGQPIGQPFSMPNVEPTEMIDSASPFPDLDLSEESESPNLDQEVNMPWEAESLDLDLDLADDENSQILTSAPNIPQSANKILYRYPYLECPDRLPINQQFSLYVQILIQSPEPKIDATAIEDRGKPEEPPELEIVLRARGFDLKGSNTKTIQIDRSDDTEERFVLTPRQLGEQQIRVDFYQHDKRIGTTRRNVFIGAMDDLDSVKIVQPNTDSTLEIKNQLVISPPDLELCIELDRRDRKTLYFTLHSTKPEIDYHHKKVGQITLKNTPEAKILSVYQELNQLAANLSRKLIPLDLEHRAADSQSNFKIAEERIISVGNKLWEELIPDALKQEYWLFQYFFCKIRRSPNISYSRLDFCQ